MKSVKLLMATAMLAIGSTAAMAQVMTSSTTASLPSEQQLWFGC